MKLQNTLRAQFMHQHKDKVMYEQPLLKGTLFIQSVGDSLSIHFDLPVFRDCPAFFHKMRPYYSVFTERELRFESYDGDVVTLEKRVYEVTLMCSANSFDKILHIRFFHCTKDEFRALYNLLTK